jgi:hypothetical protein
MQCGGEEGILIRTVYVHGHDRCGPVVFVWRPSTSPEQFPEYSLLRYDDSWYCLANSPILVGPVHQNCLMLGCSLQLGVYMSKFRGLHIQPEPFTNASSMDTCLVLRQKEPEVLEASLLTL